MLIYLSLLVCIVGCLIYALSGNSRVNEIGRLMFVSGLLAFLLRLPADSVGIIAK